jgi:hypothetical protein
MCEIHAVLGEYVWSRIDGGDMSPSYGIDRTNFSHFWQVFEAIEEVAAKGVMNQEARVVEESKVEFGLEHWFVPAPG